MKFNNSQYTSKKRRGLSGVVMILVLTMTITSWTPVSAAASITEVSSIEHDNLNGKYNSIVQVDADTFALAYAGDGDAGFIATFDISADGTTITEVSSIKHDNFNGNHNSLVQVDVARIVMALSLHLTFLQTVLQ